MIYSKYKSIPPLKPRDINYSSSKEMEKIFDTILYDLIFKDIFDILKEADIVNNKEDIIITYLKQGRIYYQNNTFKGEFNSKISKRLQELGGFYDPKQKGYVLNIIKLPLEVNRFLFNQIRVQDEAKNQILEVLDNKIDISKINIKDNPLLIDQYLKIYSKIDQHFQVSIPYDLKIDHSNNMFLKKSMTEDFVNNLELSIKNWTEKEIIKMRTDLTEKVLHGYRSESLKGFFMKHKEMSSKEAERLADGETRLALSSYNKSLAIDNDIYKYKWGHPNPNSMTARKGHVHLANLSKNGTVFDFRNKPINIDTGQPTEPGEEYNCGCFAILQV